MGIYHSETPKSIKVYKDGMLAEETRLMDFDLDKYTDECGFLGVFSAFCSVNMTKSCNDRILTLNQIKKYQREEDVRCRYVGVKITRRSPSGNRKKIRKCILM